MREQFQEQAQFAEFHGLVRDVHAMHVVDDDGLEDEVAFAGTCRHAVEYRAKIVQMLRAVRVRRMRQVIKEPPHGVQAGGVQRFQDVHCGGQKGAGPAGGVKDGDGGECLPEGADQFRAFAAGDHVLGELFDVQIVGNQVVDGRHVPGFEFGVDFLVALPAGHVLAPRLGRQGVLRRSRVVPAAALRHVIQPRGDFGRQFALVGQDFPLVNVIRDAVADGVVDVPVRVVRQQPPDFAAGLERTRTIPFDPVEQARHDGVAADVAGDVFLGVVGVHLLLVDIFLEDVAQRVEVDLVIAAQRPVVEMPLIGVEEGEDVLEGFVGDADVRVVPLQVMHVERAAVEIRNVAE